jgi:hypothetical protein
VAETGRGEELRFSTLAASQRERGGFSGLGCCFREGRGCEKNKNKARENYLIAAELGHVGSMSFAGVLLGRSDPLCWFWSGQAAKLGHLSDFLLNFAGQVQKLESGSGNAASVFQIGRTLNGNVDVEERTIFGNDYDFNNLIGPANSAISFYKAQLSACRRAIDEWSLCALRLNIYKDLRVLMGKMIWESRDLALFNVRENNAVSSPDLKRVRKSN